MLPDFCQEGGRMHKSPPKRLAYEAKVDGTERRIGESQVNKKSQGKHGAVGSGPCMLLKNLAARGRT
jgi:hypothetical protein